MLIIILITKNGDKMTNIENRLNELFKNDSSFIKDKIIIDNNTLATLYYLEGLVDLNKIGEIIISKYQKNQSIFSFPNVKEVKNIKDVSKKIIEANVIVFDYKENKIFSIEIRQLYLRSINEPDNEKIIKGPKEGLIENIIANVSLIRNKIKRKDFKVEYSSLNSEGEYRIGILYLRDKVDKKALRILKQRLKRLSKLKAIDINFLKEKIKDRKFSPFNTIGDTQRPDVCGFELLKGKIVILVDGSPNAIYLPYLFSENFQTVDDNYTNMYYASINRIFRFISFIITILLPGLYVSLLMYHQELLPMKLVLSISASRQGVPFPTFLECIILLTAFEILREAGTKTSGLLGTSLSIVGALVIGQAAVDARIISTSVVIVIAFTSVTSLINPKTAGAEIVFRFIFLILGTVLGIYGLLCGILFLIMYLIKIKSFGKCYVNKMTSFRLLDYKETYLRLPDE